MRKGAPKFVHVCVLTTLAAAALFLAKGAGFLCAAHLVGGIRSLGVEQSASYGRKDFAVPSESERDAGRAILARNIFDAATGPLWPPPQGVAPAPPPALPPVRSGERCGVEARVAASFYDPRAPADSWVVVRGALAGGNPQVATRGIAVGDRWVAEIQPEAVRLVDRTGRGCWLSMFTPESGAAIARERAAEALRLPRARKRATADPPFSPQELQAGIRILGTNRYAVRRHVIEKARANAASIARTTRIAVRGKDPGSGLRLARLRKGGLLAHLGLRRGDIVRSINGVLVSDVGKLLNAYAQLDRMNRVALSVTRGRESLLLEYYVQ